MDEESKMSDQSCFKKMKSNKKLFVNLILIFMLIAACVLVGIFSFIYFYTSPVDCRCRLGVKARIINGHNAWKNFIPYQVSLATSDPKQVHFCSGVIVNGHWILTAAHCLAGLSSSQIVVQVGLNELNETNLEARTYGAFRIFHHPSFKTDGDVLEMYDIGLIRLFFPIKFVKGEIEPACLNLDEKKIYDDDLLISGWGTVKRSYLRFKDKKLIKGNLSNVLKYAYYYEDDKMDCDEKLICARPRDSKDSNCHGDSGGPISFTRNGKTTVEGLASFTLPQERGDRLYFCVGPSGYARLNSNKEYITSFIGSNYCGNPT